MAKRPPLIDMISKHEAFSASDLERVIKLHRERGGLLAELLVQEGMMSEEDLFFLFSSELGVPVIPEERLRHLKLSSDVRRKVPRELAAERVLIPLDLDAKNKLMSVVMFDPSDAETLDVLRKSCKVVEVRCYLARRGAILGAMSAVYDTEKTPRRPVGRRSGPARKRTRTRPPKPASKATARRTKRAPVQKAATKKAPVKKAPVKKAPVKKGKPLSAVRTRQPAKAPARQGPKPRPKPPPTPIPPEPKVELDPSLRQEIAAMETRPGRMVRVPERPDDPLHGEPTALLTRRAHDSDEVTTPPMTESRRPLREVRGRSLFRDDQSGERTQLFREVDTVQEQQTEELDLSDIEIEDDIAQTPKVMEMGEDEQLEVQELDAGDLTVMGSDDLELTPPLPAAEESDVTPVLSPDESGLTPLPDVMHMEELDALLRELLSSVGVLVSMLEERIDPSGGVCREYGQLARMVAREAGMDELTISRVALAAYLYALDLTLRNEVGEQGPGDAKAAFNMTSGSPGGLGPSLRTLGARALGLSEDGSGAETPGVQLVRLVAQYLSLRSESQGTDLGTMIQLLKAGGADASLVDALARAMDGSERTMVMRSPPGFMD